MRKLLLLHLRIWAEAFIEGMSTNAVQRYILKYYFTSFKELQSESTFSSMIQLLLNIRYYATLFKQFKFSSLVVWRPIFFFCESKKTLISKLLQNHSHNHAAKEFYIQGATQPYLSALLLFLTSNEIKCVVVRCCYSSNIPPLYKAPAITVIYPVKNKVVMWLK